MALVLDGVLALGERVPQLDALVAARGHDLPVVHGEGHGQHVLGVVLEPAGRLAGAQIPQTEVLVPGSRQSKVACKQKCCDELREEEGLLINHTRLDYRQRRGRRRTRSGSVRAASSAGLRTGRPRGSASRR